MFATCSDPLDQLRSLLLTEHWRHEIARLLVHLRDAKTLLASLSVRNPYLNRSAQLRLMR